MCGCVVHGAARLSCLEILSRSASEALPSSFFNGRRSSQNIGIRTMAASLPPTAIAWYYKPEPSRVHVNRLQSDGLQMVHIHGLGFRV